MDPIIEEDDKVDIQALSFQLEALKEGIYKRDTQIKELEESFTDEKEKTEKLSKLLKLEEQKNEDGIATIERFEKKLAQSDELINKLREQLSVASSPETANDTKTRISDVERQIKDVQYQVDLWKSRCEDLESNLEEEKLQHEQVKFKLNQSEELLKNYRNSENMDDDDVDGVVRYQNIISGLKASIDVQSERNIELHQQLQRLKKDSEDAKKMVKSFQERSEKDKKLIDELNNQNQREYQRNEKLRTDIQRLKRDIDSWRKIQTDMKSQYQELRLMYDGVCKHADDQKREMLEMKLLMDRDKRSISRQREDIDKLKVRATSLKQTYDDIKDKYDESFKQLEEKKAENRSLNSQLQTAKKTTSELTSSNKDLKKRSEFSQKELIDKHKLLLQKEEKLKDLESALEERDVVIEESKTALTDAKEKAEKYSSEAAIKEKDLMDRINLLQNLQHKIQMLEGDNKKLAKREENLKVSLVGKDEIVENKDKEIKEKETIIYELEQRIIVLERGSKDIEDVLEKVQRDLMNKETEFSESTTSIASYEQKLADKENKISELHKEVEQLEEKNESLKAEYSKKADNHIEEKNGLFQQLEHLAAEQETKQKQVAQLTHDLEEIQKRVHLQNELLKDVEVKFESEDGKLIEYKENIKQKDGKISELEIALDEKQRVMEELKRELEESEIIQVYLNEINSLKKVVAEEMSRNEQLQQKLKMAGVEEASRLEDEKKEVMLQMTKELKREKQKSQAVIADLKDDIRVLENNVENEKERSNMLSKEIELKERKRNSEREDFQQHIEELQELYSKENEEKCQIQEKLKKLEVSLKETERKRLHEIEEFEQNKLQILTETKSNLILDRQEKIEELKDELQTKKELLCEAERRFDEADKKHENEKLELQILSNEKDDLIASLRKENLDLRKVWQIESEWMEENRMDKNSRPVVNVVPRNENNEVNLLISQKKAIQEIKRKIQADYKLDQILPLTDQTDEKRLDILYENSLKSQDKVSKKEAIRMVIEKLAIVLLLSPLAFFFSCEFSLTLAAILMPLAYIIHQKPWKNNSDQERILSEALNGLTTRLAAECADSENLRQTVDYLKRKDDYGNNNRGYSSVSNDKIHQQLADERQFLIKELERQSKEEHEKQKDELLRIKQKQEGDRRRLQRQQALIDKLEVILQEKEIKSRLGQFWGYEELKMAINRLKHEREIEKSRSECSEDEILKKRVTSAMEEASSKEISRKIESFIAVAILSSILLICFSVNFSFTLIVGCLIIIASCSLVYGVWSWREVENVKSKLQIDKDVIEAQKIEIDELTTLMGKEYEVVNKQRQAIEALERRLNDEYKKNKDYQLTIARLTWVFQESEEMRKEIFDVKDPELQKFAENHARDKFSIFRGMQKQLKEHSSSTEEQRRVIDELKNATSVIVNAAEKQMSHIKLRKESKLEKDKTLFSNISKWSMLTGVVACLSIISAFLSVNKTFSICLPLSFVFVIGVLRFIKYVQRHRKNKTRADLESSSARRPSLQLSFSVTKQSVFDIIFVAALAFLFFNFSSVSLNVALTCFVIIIIFRLITYILHRRSINSEMVSWNDVVEDLWSQIHERTELIDVQTEEIQTLKKLLEVERSYSRHAERLLKDAKGVSDEGFEELTEVERLKHRASELQTEEDHLVNYELDEMKIFLEEEQKSNVQLRKTLAETEEANRALSNECTNLKRKLEMEQLRRKEINMVKEEDGLLQDRIDELIEDLEAEQKTKQELNAQLIEERSSRELAQIELQDIKEKIRDEKHANNSLREQVLKLKNSQHEATALKQQLEEERLTTQRHYITLIEALDTLRENNLGLKRQTTDIPTSDNDRYIRNVRDQIEEQQEQIERIQTLLEDLAHTKKAMKYQDLMDELKELRQKLATGEATPSALLEQLELEREKNKILEEAVDELQRQQSDQSQMLENERRRSVQLARQLSGEDIPLMVEEEANEDLDDKRGVLYWLGTNGGLTDWKNPGESGLVLISRSSYGHGRATDVANRKPSWCSTSNKPNQWWKIDFGEKRLVVPTAYSLRHGWSGNAGALRHWLCEGSLDGKRWVVLRQHINDETVNTAYGYGYWKIPNDEQNAYRFFRVRQTGLNSSGRNALRLCGFEVYGKLEID